MIKCYVTQIACRFGECRADTQGDKKGGKLSLVNYSRETRSNTFSRIFSSHAKSDTFMHPCWLCATGQTLALSALLPIADQPALFVADPFDVLIGTVRYLSFRSGKLSKIVVTWLAYTTHLDLEMNYDFLHLATCHVLTKPSSRVKEGVIFIKSLGHIILYCVIVIDLLMCLPQQLMIELSSDFIQCSIFRLTAQRRYHFCAWNMSAARGFVFSSAVHVDPKPSRYYGVWKKFYDIGLQEEAFSIFSQ